MEIYLEQGFLLKQKISSKMLLSIKYLDYSLEDLNTELEKQLEENILLERELDDNEKISKLLNTDESLDLPVFDRDTTPDLAIIEKKNEFNLEDWKQFSEDKGQNFEGYKTRNPDYDDFFDMDCDIKFIKPMSLKDIAIKLKLNESTISRATLRKYVITDFGTFELKKFFSKSVFTMSGEKLSILTLKNTIKELIEDEDKKKPYSDIEISKRLRVKYNLDISQKTVCNYRKDMNILSSSKRKVKK